MYHEADSQGSWSVPAKVGRCRDRRYEDGGFSSIDGVLEVEFQLPKTMGEQAANKEEVLDLEIRINGRRLKQGPYPTHIRPARLSPAMCDVMGMGTKGAEPGQEQVLEMQLVNELGENMTTCGSLALTVGVEKCGMLLTQVGNSPAAVRLCERHATCGRGSSGAGYARDPDFAVADSD